MSTWSQLSFELPEEALEALTIALGARGVGIEIRDAETLAAPAPGRAVVIAYVEVGAEAALVDDVAALLARLGHGRGSWSVGSALSDEDEWRDAWKRFFHPTRVGARLVVRPTWEPYAPAPGDVVIDLDPGRAFGTGAHASTRLCLEALDASAAAGRRVERFLDLGTGSGILSIAAAKLWPEASGLAVDVDEEAVAVARENLAGNGLDEARVATRAGSLADVDERFDVVVANIQADVHLVLLPELPARLAPGALVVLSGILAEQADEVARAAERLGPVARRASADGWVALVVEAALPGEVGRATDALG